MSKFENFMNSVGDVCEKAVKETAKLTDVAATKVKIKAEEARLCDRYEALGKVAESYLRDKDVIPEQIAAALDEITKVKDKIASLEAELAEKKAKHEEKNDPTNTSEAEED
ncbi:MAG: hypothetical protein IJZ89_03610 [Clostridia bacterium]|nr:hypothetical protein [Clostridia bacterium]